MDTAEEMIEEHLDDEYQNSEGFAEIKIQIAAMEKAQLSLNFDYELQYKLKKALALLNLYVRNYQRITIINNRRSKQRLRKKQNSLRNLFLQSLMNMQIRYVEMLPLTIDPSWCVENIVDNVDYEENNLPQCNLEYDTENTAVPDLDYYRDIVLKFTNDQWLETFHMPKYVFDLICSKLKMSAKNLDVDFEAWVVMCLYMLATGSKFQSVAVLFNVNAKFARASLFKFLAQLLKEFSENTLIMPNSKTELEDIAKGFQKASNITPCVAGVLSLFEMPSLCECGPFKTCGAKTLKVQICIDNNLLFRKVETTTQKPVMFLRAPNEVSHSWKNFTGDCLVPYFVVAPSGYPLRTWLMRKYDDPREIWEYEFNKCLGSLNIFREVSLKRLFGRWQILKSSECILPEAKSVIVKACCLLHNILEESEEYFSVEWCANMDLSRYESRLKEAKFYTDSEPAREKRDSIAKLIRVTNVYNNKK